MAHLLKRTRKISLLLIGKSLKGKSVLIAFRICPRLTRLNPRYRRIKWNHPSNPPNKKRANEKNLGYPAKPSRRKRRCNSSWAQQVLTTNKQRRSRQNSRNHIRSRHQKWIRRIRGRRRRRAIPSKVRTIPKAVNKKSTTCFKATE